MTSCLRLRIRLVATWVVAYVYVLTLTEVAMSVLQRREVDGDSTGRNRTGLGCLGDCWFGRLVDGDVVNVGDGRCGEVEIRIGGGKRQLPSVGWLGFSSNGGGFLVDDCSFPLVWTSMPLGWVEDYRIVRGDWSLCGPLLSGLGGGSFCEDLFVGACSHHLT